MKNFQLRISDEVHRTLVEIAQSRELTISDIVREALEVYSIGVFYSQEGKRLIWEDAKTGSKAEVLIPGFTHQAKNLRPSGLIRSVNIPRRQTRQK